MMAGRWSAEDLHRYAKRGAGAQAAVDAITNGYRSIDMRVAASATVRHKNRMNGLETAYSKVIELERLAGLWQWWAFEPFKLRLASGAYYTPDFVLLDPGSHVVIHETKGHWREAARVRIKVAAELYPFFRFVAVQRERKRGTWTFKQY